MDIKVGIDIGSDSIKAVVLRNGSRDIEKIEPIKVLGKPLVKLKTLLLDLKQKIKNGDKVFVALTGTGAVKVSQAVGIEALPEIEALSASVNLLDEDVEHIIEIGAETQKYLSFFRDKKTGAKLLEDVIPGGKCAGGTGSFLEYMHKRLKYPTLEDFVETGLRVKDPASISGRCAVFAESDIVHHYQKGTPRERIVAGIHQAVARSFKNLIKKGTLPRKKIALVGGVAKNRCILRHLANELKLDDDQIVVPKDAQHMGAIGAAMLAEKPVNLSQVIDRLDRWISTPFDYEHTSPLKLEKSVIMSQPEDEAIKDVDLELAALGVDIGSVSTKAVVISKIDGKYRVLASFYRRTEGNPVEAVKDVISKIGNQLKEKNIKIKKLVAATTGSGRYLTGYFIGANEIKDEITAQAHGVSTFIKEKDLTVIEIGGQDSKFLKLRDGVIFDFEMNWACAAGTGALIEKHAKNLGIPITEFGDYALKGDKPPIINSTCAVFSEAALMYFQQNNVSVENLCAGACLASAKNYVIKVVRNRSIGEKVAFQGAVAFNKGMIAAFETILEKPIIVPPYPHLTGAIGCARIAYESQEKKPTPSKFRGFENIVKAKYNLTSFTCKHCGNECSVNVFKVGKEVFYQGDRCDRYSGAQKQSKGEGIPDLFKERQEMLLNAYKPKNIPEDAPTVGIPRGLLFNDYYPLFSAFFGELGCKVIPSPPTDKQIIRRGMEKVVAEPCFPIKVAHGHSAYLIEQGVDYLFLPAIMRAEEPYGDYELAVTCPYIQTAPDVIKAALEIDKTKTKLLSPVLFLDRGFKHFLRKMTEVGRTLGKSPQEVKKALKVALKVQEEFNKKVQEKGREVLRNLPANQLAFVIIARPYSLYDEGINMNVAKKVRDEGYLAIPFDMLPLKDRKWDPSDTWVNIYPVQGQKKVAAARFIKSHPNLHALVVTYFGCGPDAFIDQMFYKELNRQYLTIQIDEHTSDTGILTRIQAHLSSARFEEEKAKERMQISTETTPITEIIGKKRLWIPYMNEASKILAACLRAYGIDAKALSPSKDPALTLARDRISGDVCTPMLYTTQDMLERASAPDFDPDKEAFFQGKSGGPCRYGMYFMLEKLIIEEMVGKKVDFVTLGNKNSDGGLGSAFLVMAWDSLVAHDMLLKMLLHTRPYEIHKGDSEAIFDKYISKMEKIVEDPKNKPKNIIQMAGAVTGGILHKLYKLLEEARLEFEKVPANRTPRPLVGIVGEYFVRQRDDSNFYIIRTLEEMGCEVWLAPGTEFLGYSNYITGYHAEDEWKDGGNFNAWKEIQLRKTLNELAMGREHKLFEAIKPYVGHLYDIPPAEVVDLGKEYLTPFFGGEAILSMGKSEDFVRRGLDGIVSVGPFNCMPSIVVAALSRELRRKHNKIPFLNIDFDGFDDNTRQVRISAFVSQVKERMKLKREKVKV